MKTIDNKVHKITFIGLFFAVAIILNLLENMIPPVLMLPPGVKLGLSNIVTMYCLFFVGRSYAFGIVLMKALFVLLTRGFTAGLLSLAGGLFAVTIMIILMAIFNNKCSYLILSVSGGIFHNLGQITAASIILNTPLILYYFPILVFSGVAAGMITALLLKIIMPALNKITVDFNKGDRC